MSKSWDSNILKKLKALVGKGLSTSEIGKRLGMSKNAIVGKLHRLGWNTKAVEAPVAKKSAKAEPKKTVAKKTAVKPVAKPKASTPAKKTPSVAATKKPKAPVVKPVVAKETPAPKKTGGGHAIAGSKGTNVYQRAVQHALEMANLKPGQCRWPIGDPDSEHFHFCGQPVFVGKPYCYEHCKQAYQFTPPKKK